MPFPPANADLLLTDLADPHLSLHAVAAKHDTNLAALVLWMNAPEVAERLNQLRDACTARARLAATTLLSNCASTLMAIADAQMADAEALRSEQTQSGPRVHSADPDADPGAIAPSTPAEPPSLPTPREHALRVALLRTRAHESARRALSMVLRIARWHEPRPREHHQPHQASRSETNSPLRASEPRMRPSSADRPFQLESLLAALAEADADPDPSITPQPATHPSARAIGAEQGEGKPCFPHPAHTPPAQPAINQSRRPLAPHPSGPPLADGPRIDARAGPSPPVRCSA